MMANELTYLSSQIGNAHWYNRLCNRSLRIRKSSGMGAADNKTPMCTLYEMLCQSTSLFPESPVHRFAVRYPSRGKSMRLGHLEVLLAKRRSKLTKLFVMCTTSIHT